MRPFFGGAKMDLVLRLSLWLHFLGLAAAIGGGIALSQTGPKLVTVPQNEANTIWNLERTFSIIAMAGLAVLIMTGPVLAIRKYSGFSDMPSWFWVKMALVAIATVAVFGHEIAGRRFKAGNRNAFRWMVITGRTAGITMVLVVLAAVLAFG
jgi:uncharacterized membrane protein